MRLILGISAYYHDSAAVLLRDGEVVAAAQEERFTRRKNDERFPLHAIRFCLDHANLCEADLDAVVFYDKPILKFARLLETALAIAPLGLTAFLRALPSWLGEKLNLRKTIRDELPGLSPDCAILFTQHHQAHAASAFFPSPFAEAAILTVDGVGEYATTTIGQGRGHDLELLKELHFPHSLGLLYSAFTAYCGFRVNSGEYKLMGLAPYGQPTYAATIRDHLLDLKPDGSFRLNLEYFDFLRGIRMTNERFHRLFGGPPRAPEARIEERHMDVARSVQTVTEEVMLRLARHAGEITNQRHLCLAGGVALNCVANGVILREKLFERIWIQPAAGDAGGALGAALAAWHAEVGRRGPSQPPGPRESSGTPDSEPPRLPPFEHPLPSGGGEGWGEGAARSFSGAMRTQGSKDSFPSDRNGGTGPQQGFKALIPGPEDVTAPRKTGVRDRMHGALLGPQFSAEETRGALDALGAIYQTRTDDELMARVVELLREGKVVGWFQGRMEFGPRALGNRSILGDARSPSMQSIINLKIKFRESFRPFAPVVRLERASDYFELDDESPYMLLVAPVKKALCLPVTGALKGFDRLSEARSTIPAVTHVDFSARIQTVTREQHPLLYRLLEKFEEATGCGVLVNTSFNVRDEPIVCTPDDAYRCFVRTEMDYLVAGNCLLERTAQPGGAANSGKSE